MADCDADLDRIARAAALGLPQWPGRSRPSAAVESPLPATAARRPAAVALPGVAGPGRRREHGGNRPSANDTTAEGTDSPAEQPLALLRLVEAPAVGVEELRQFAEGRRPPPSSGRPEGE